MKRSKTLVLSSLLMLAGIGAAMGQVQQYYNQPLQPQLKKIAPVPSTVSEAYKLASKIKTPESGIAAPAFVSEISSVVEKIQALAQSVHAKSSSPAKASDEQAKLIEQMKDPAWQKKFEAMSQSEQIAVGMKIQKAMSSGLAPVKAEDDAVSDAIEKAGEIMAAVGEFSTVRQQESTSAIVSKYKENWAVQSGKVDEWAIKEIKKLPIVSGSPGKDPNKIRAIRLGAIDQKISMVNKDLKALTAGWNKVFSFMNKSVMQFDAELKKINYFQQFKNDHFKSQMLGHQGHLAQLIGAIAADYGDLIVAAAQLQHERNTLESSPLTIF